MAHTQGPWRLDGDANAMNLDVVSGDGRIAMLDCENFEIPDDELKANAALIAAAPDLLATLENVAAWIEQYLETEIDAPGYINGTQYELNRVKEAIAKAKGAE